MTPFSPTLIAHRPLDLSDAEVCYIPIPDRHWQNRLRYPVDYLTMVVEGQDDVNLADPLFFDSTTDRVSCQRKYLKHLFYLN